jgi:hypothetical protein
MASQKQIEANRLNAQKSTGPRSVEGKARASMNALKIGIDARSHTIPGEPISQLEDLTDEYYQRFCPTTPEQRMLVVDCEWLLRRFRRVEGQMWENPIFEITFAKAFRDDSDHFARLQRRIDATQRNYHNALHELERLQAEEAAADSDSEPRPPSYPRKTKPLNPKTGSFRKPCPQTCQAQSRRQKGRQYADTSKPCASAPSASSALSGFDPEVFLSVSASLR